MKIFTLTANKTHQFFSIVINFHEWRWIEKTPVHSMRTNEIYRGIIISVNLFYYEVRLRFIPIKQISNE